MLKKSEIRKYMYKNHFANKEAFWNHIEKTRLRRHKNKYVPKNPSPIYIRYLHKIPSKNKNILKNKLIDAMGSPSHVKFIYKNGDLNLKYLGSKLGKQYSNRCKYRIRTHLFEITIPRKLTISVDKFDNLYNIYCRKTSSKDGLFIYKCKWIQHKRGFNFDIINGFVATTGNISYHATTKSQAINGLKNKIKKVKYSNRDKFKLNDKINLPLFIKLTGACKAGCISFCREHKISLKKSMTFKSLFKLLEKYNKEYYINKLKPYIFII